MQPSNRFEFRPVYSCAAIAAIALALNCPSPARAGDVPCGAGTACPPGSYCHTPIGECGGQGFCAPIPEFCPLIFDPVCGCDGQTYSNSCFAAAAGVSVAHAGPCGKMSECTESGQCDPGFYCAKPLGECDGPGMCMPMPDVCDLVFNPVCGCDGQTYTNECFAAAAGVSVAHLGPCGIKSPCDEGTPCGEGLYCQTPFGDCDGQGTCAAIPFFCPLIFAPVCGCDGATYDNACFAAASGVSVAHQGFCGKKSECVDSGQCPPGFYCHKEPGDCNGPGACEPMPDICPAIFAPVCGCDGVTYGNACEAAAAGVSVAHEGPCEKKATCTDNGDCPDGFYCQKEIGDCDGVGTCEPIPTGGCPEIFFPVCGCDGLTYINPCEAAAAGVSIAHNGPCAIAPCSDSGDCSKGFYCKFPDGECGGKGGVCERIPELCILILDPVCGCDGLTYTNSCFAAAAGVSIAHDGPCGKEPTADLNGDGVVDGLDLGILLANWSIPPDSPGCGGALPCPADLNGDGVVDGLDLGILLANWTI